MKRLLPGTGLLLPLLILMSLTLHAQDRLITGKITDAAQSTGLPNATVTVKGTTIGTKTDEDGNFRLNVPAGSTTLVISSVGFSTREVAITSANVNVSLTASNTALNEVIVVGYGTQRKRDVTGAIAKVSGEQLTTIAAPSFEAALQGKAPGVQVIQGSGLAGSSSVIRIRGIGSISASGDPLYVIDGIPITADPFLRGNSGAMNQNPLASLNPNDIESVEVLKDAGAAGIYGSRGANGVILITTKRGKSGKPTFNYSNKLGLSTYANKPDFVTSGEWLQLRQEAWENDGNTGFPTLVGYNSDIASETQRAADFTKARAVNTDWWDLLTQHGFINEHNLSVSSGTNRLRTYAGLNYSNNEGYIKNNAYTRYSVRLNMDYKLTDKFKISLTSAYNRGVNKRVPSAWDGGIGDAMSGALPIFPVYNSNGTYFTGGANPVRRMNETKRREIDNRFIGGLSLEYELIKNLTLRAVGSIEGIRSFDDQFETNLWINRPTADSGYAKRFPYWGKNWTTTVTANYLWNPGEDNRFNFLVGGEAQESQLKEYSSEIGQFSGQPYWEKPSAYRDRRDALLEKNSSGVAQMVVREKSGATFTFNSIFARINYTYKDRYAFQLLGRVDGSSKFGTNNKRGFFPAASAAWTISEEDFMNDVTNIDFLKLRASYGIVGNAGVPSGSYFDKYQRGGNNYNNIETIYLDALGNPDLKWETMRNFDFAIEFAAFKSRLTGELAYYHKLTTDILLQPGTALSSGYDKAWRNVDGSKILNEGYELSLNAKLVDKNRFRWNVGGNIAKNFNEVISWPLGPDAVSGGTNDTRIVEGLPVGVNYLVRYYGVDPADGSPLWLDNSGKVTKTFSLNNRVYVGRVVPDYIGGFSTLAGHKAFDLSALFTFVIGGNIYENSGKYQFLGVSNKNWNFRKDFLDRWTKPGDVTQYPRLVSRASSYTGVPSEDQFNSTMFLRDASYLRMRELTLSYKVPADIMQRLKLREAKLFLTGMNLLTFSKFPGGDPEIARDFENAQDRNLSPNITYLTPPQQKSLIFGVNVSF
jgi:TonB-dependent starch-binding outer membrane protein SusC